MRLSDYGKHRRYPTKFIIFHCAYCDKHYTERMSWQEFDSIVETAQMTVGERIKHSLALMHLAID